MSKLNYKTVTLSGAEQEVRISGQNCDIRNDGADIIYAAGESGIAAGNDGVVSIPAGQAVKLHGTNGTVFLLGTGSALLCGNDYSDPVFKAAAATGGGEDTVARTAISTHAADSDIHITAEERESWNGKTTLSECAGVFCNPNILINPDFKMNQRGLELYSSTGMSVDRWKFSGDGDSYYNATEKTLATGTTGTYAILSQSIDVDPVKLVGKTLALSADLKGDVNEYLSIRYLRNGEYIVIANQRKSVGIDTLHRWNITVQIPDDTLSTDILQVAIYCNTTNASLHVDNAKLELGSVATPFVPPDPTTELMKCQRYYQIRTTGDIDPVDLRPSMATITDIKQREDGNYEYIAEL